MIFYILGGYPELNRELTVPHTVVLPIELYPPLITMYIEINNIYIYIVYLFNNITIGLQISM